MKYLTRIRLCAHMLVLCVLMAFDATAQISTPNALGVAMGHLHYRVSDVAAEADFWQRIGGTQNTVAVGALISFPNVLVRITEGESTGGTEGSVLNHVAFRVESLEAIERRGFEMHYNDAFPGIASVYSPSGERIELFDDVLATNTGFDSAPGYDDALSDASASPRRHNLAVAAPIVTHHVHFYLPEDQVLKARAWYVEMFGAVPGQRWRYAAADLPGMNFNFSAAETLLAPTQGRTLDHIGFEIRDLQSFITRLEASGIAFDRPYAELDNGLKLAFFTDPWGTYIELTEGLGDY